MGRTLMIFSKLRAILTVLGGLALIWAILLGGRPQLSWAAPAQSPDRQTIPTRPPTEEPTPSPELPTPPPSPTANQPTVQPPPGNDDGQDETDGPPTPLQPTASPESQNPVAPPASAPTESGEGVKPTPQSTSPATGPDSQARPTLSVGTEDPTGQPQMVLLQADLSLSLTVDKSAPRVGETITFTLVVSNSGPAHATNVTVNKPLPARLALNLAVPGQGNFQPDHGLWTIAGITAGQQALLTLTVTMTETGLVTYTAEIITADQFDPDSTPGNALEGEDDQATVLMVVSPPATSATELPGNGPVTAGQGGAGPAQVAETGSLFWLYALIGGIILALIGLLLVNRS